MDGHERADVVKYRQEEFLPRMEAFESRMAQYIPDEPGNEFVRVEPMLKPGEREVIVEFHNESCCQANDHTTSAWYFSSFLSFTVTNLVFRLPDDKQPLRKKGRGRLIHISDFIEQVNGRLVVYDENGSIKQSARKIIYPGANGDAYWDCPQLIKQMKMAIDVFEQAHPGCEGLFIFDHSSAHASLAPDALRAFEMNKTNGGKQRFQKDTIIPFSNPDPCFRGSHQKMTTENGEQKGLKQTLEEHISKSANK